MEIVRARASLGKPARSRTFLALARIPLRFLMARWEQAFTAAGTQAIGTSGCLAHARRRTPAEAAVLRDDIAQAMQRPASGAPPEPLTFCRILGIWHRLHDGVAALLWAAMQQMQDGRLPPRWFLEGFLWCCCRRSAITCANRGGRRGGRSGGSAWRDPRGLRLFGSLGAHLGESRWARVCSFTCGCGRSASSRLVLYTCTGVGAQSTRGRWCASRSCCASCQTPCGGAAVVPTHRLGGCPGVGCIESRRRRCQHSLCPVVALSRSRPRCGRSVGSRAVGRLAADRRDCAGPSTQDAARRADDPHLQLAPRLRELQRHGHRRRPHACGHGGNRVPLRPVIRLPMQARRPRGVARQEREADRRRRGRLGGGISAAPRADEGGI